MYPLRVARGTNVTTIHLYGPYTRDATRNAKYTTHRTTFRYNRGDITFGRIYHHFTITRHHVGDLIYVNLRGNLRNVIRTTKSNVYRHQMPLYRHTIHHRTTRRIDRFTHRHVLYMIATRNLYGIYYTRAIGNPAHTGFYGTPNRHLTYAFTLFGTLTRDFHATLHARRQRRPYQIGDHRHGILTDATRSTRHLLYGKTGTHLYDYNRVLSSLMRLVTGTLLQICTIVRFHSNGTHPRIISLLLHMAFFGRLYVHMNVTLHYLYHQNANRYATTLYRLRHIIPYYVPYLSTNRRTRRLLLPIITLCVLLRLLPITTNHYYVLYTLCTNLAHRGGQKYRHISGATGNVNHTPHYALSYERHVGINGMLPHFTSLLTTMSLYRRFHVNMIPSTHALFQRYYTNYDATRTLKLRNIIFLNVTLSTNTGTRRHRGFPILQIDIRPLIRPIGVTRIIYHFRVFHMLLRLLHDLYVPTFVSTNGTYGTLTLDKLRHSHRLYHQDYDTLHIRPFQLHDTTTYAYATINRGTTFTQVYLYSTYFLQRYRLRLITTIHTHRLHRRPYAGTHTNILPYDHDQTNDVLSTTFHFPTFPHFYGTFQYPLIHDIYYSHDYANTYHPIYNTTIIFHFPAFSIFFRSFQYPFTRGYQSPLSFHFRGFRGKQRHIIHGTIYEGSTHGVIRAMAPHLRTTHHYGSTTRQATTNIYLPANTITSHHTIFRPPHIHRNLLMRIVR